MITFEQPTVGVDPILRQSIWEYLQMLTSKLDLTIIITTQYIEEARSADLVSFMREGKLLMERNPNELLQSMALPTLEAVFLSLCQMDSIQSSARDNGLVSLRQLFLSA